MRRIFLISMLSCISMMSSVIGQCVFPTFEKFGLICDEAHFLCGYEMDGFTGRLLEAKSPLPQPDPLCSGAGQADNIQWFSFVADDVDIEIIIRYSNCTGTVSGNSPGLQVGIFENCELSTVPGKENEPLGSIYCIEGTNYTDIVLTPDTLDIEVGQLYLIFIDGYANSTCDFEIDVIKGICTEAPAPALECEQDCGVISQYPGNQGCTLFRDYFSFSPSNQIIADVFGCNPDVSNTRLDSILCVEWDIQPSMGYNYISTSFEFYDSLEVISTLSVEWTLPGTYTVKPILTINPLFSTCQEMCVCSDNVAYTIVITESEIVQLPEIGLCAGECIDFCGLTYCQTGVFECPNRDLCLIEIQSIVERPNIEIDEGLFFLCPGECFEFQDVNYCDENSYEVSDSVACDTTYIFQLEELIFSIALVQADNLINCSIAQAYLEGEWNTNFTGNIYSAWLSELGDTVSFSKEYIAMNSGEYTFVAWPENMKGCKISLSHIVNKDDAIPVANLLSPLLNCNNPLDRITINTLDNIMKAEWTGPNGYVSNDINAEVDQAGIYAVTITATNGCTLMLNTEVIGDFEKPDLEVMSENLTCSENTPKAEFTSMSTLVSHQWNLPDGSNSFDEILNLNSDGNYSLEVTATNGCTEVADFNVVDLSYDPSLQLNEDTIWRCNDTEVILDLSSKEIQGLIYYWTNIEGSILSNSISITITSPGVYILTIADEEVECIGSDTVRIIEDPNPFLDVELTISPPICNGGKDGFVEILTSEGGAEPYTYEIDGTQYSDIGDMDFGAGMYVMKVTDIFGCVVSKDFEVPATEAFIVTIEPELSIRFGQMETLLFETSLDDNEIGLIEWSNDKGNILGFDRTLNYVGKEIEFINLRVENLEGCEVIAEIRVDLSFDVDIYYPNVFSPNNDGNNDLFILYNNGFPEMADDLKIFDRAGELVYKSSHLEFNETQYGWDGTFNGDKCLSGVYVFILEYTLMNGSSKSISGAITLIR